MLNLFRTFEDEVQLSQGCRDDRPLRDQRLSRPWSHSVVLKPGPLDWESSMLTIRPLLPFFWCHCWLWANPLYQSIVLLLNLSINLSVGNIFSCNDFFLKMNIVAISCKKNISSGNDLQKFILQFFFSQYLL